MVQCQSGINTLTRNRQGFSLSEERSFIVWSSGDRGRILDERLLEVAQSQEHAAQARMRKCTRRSDRGSRTVCLDCLFKGATQHCNMPNS